MNLLVSVRSVAEALAALEGGADLIDIKEPVHGSLGRADDAVIAAIVAAVEGKRPLSAAMGELRAEGSLFDATGLDYVKFGLANCRDFPWGERLLELRSAAGSIVVPTAYADWQRADAPPVRDVVGFVAKHDFPVLLIDTQIKDGCNLFSWLDRNTLAKLTDMLREVGCRIALAGSFTERDLEAIAVIQPDWVAVRGAVCANADRNGTIDVERVRRLKAALSRSERRH